MTCRKSLCPNEPLCEIKISPVPRRKNGNASSVNINTRGNSMQYVFQYINHKHGIKTAKSICHARAFSRALYIFGEGRVAFWRFMKIMGRYFLSVDLVLKRDRHRFVIRILLASWRVYLESFVPHFCTIALHDIAMRISISEMYVRRRSSIVNKNTSSITCDVLNIDRSLLESCCLSDQIHRICRLATGLIEVRGGQSLRI